MFTCPPDWIENPPDDLETIVGILDIHADDINEKSLKGETLRKLLKTARKHHEKTVAAVKDNDPQAYFRPSYDQALLLNCWVWGITFPLCFAANRIGKTSAFVFNGVLWIFPNHGGWKCFKPYTDDQGREVYILERPKIDYLQDIQDYIKTKPELMGDPYKQPYEQPNLEKFQQLRRDLPRQFQSCYPLPPIQTGGQIWLGAPDNDFHRLIIMPRWRSLLPKPLLKDSDSDRVFIVTTRSETNPITTAHHIICKSYESEDTKWSGDAVQGIILTEGFDQSVLDEIKNRVTGNAFASWDYTPAEPRNQGKKVNLAYRVYKGEEQLPLVSFPFLKFSVRNTPDFIIPANKKADMIRMWEGKEAGASRLDGNFFASSGLVLSSIDKPFHCITNHTIATLQLLFPNGRFYRAIDPGWDHPTVCVWGYLTQQNIWFIYRVYVKRGATIAERCQDIIRLSHNERESFTRSGQTFYREVHPHKDSEVFNLTSIDYHTFKDDEVSGLSYANQYINEGLIVTESTHMKPEERATKTNTLLDKNAHPYLPHPITNIAPGSRIYFLMQGEGVAAMVAKFDDLFWDRLKSGENRGEPKDKVPIHGDDELDGLSYLTCGPYVWTTWQPTRREPRDSEPEFLNYTRPTSQSDRLKELRDNHGFPPERVAALQQQQVGHFG